MLLIGREREKGRTASKSGKSRKNRESPKKDKKGRTSPDRETPRLNPPCLAALEMRDTPPYRAIPFRDATAEGGGIAPICLVFVGYRASITEILLLRGGGIAPLLCMYSKGETLRKGEGVSYPIGHIETPKPIERNSGVSLR